MAWKADFLRVFSNGYDLTNDTQDVDIQHLFGSTGPTPQNVGIEEYGVGLFDPRFNLAGLRKSGQGVLTAYNLFTNQQSGGLGLNYATEHVVSVMIGNGQYPGAVGDPAYMFDGSVFDFPDNPALADLFKFNVPMMPRGKRGLGGKVLGAWGNSPNEAAPATGTLTGGILDRGSHAASGTSKGGVLHLQVLQPSGAQAAGTVTLTTNPSDGDTCSVNGTTYRFKTTIAQANDVALGATSAATALNFFQALIGSVTGAGTGGSAAYYTGTTPVPPGTITVSKPSSNVVNFTAVAYGTAGNAYTLAKTGANITVSGATFSGGAAGDSYTVTVASSTTSGGAYTTFLTFTSTLQALGAERQEIAVGTLINRYVKVTASTGGSTNKPIFNVIGGFYFF